MHTTPTLLFLVRDRVVSQAWEAVKSKEAQEVYYQENKAVVLSQSETDSRLPSLWFSFKLRQRREAMELHQWEDWNKPRYMHEDSLAFPREGQSDAVNV